MAESTGLTLAGKIVKVCDINQISDTFSKRELWIEIDILRQFQLNLSRTNVRSLMV